jgi:hypothetical protein
MHKAYNSNLFKSELISESDLESFTCPYCQKSLMIKKGDITRFDTEKSDKTFFTTNKEEDLEGYFMSLIKCTNPKCCEIVIVTGSTYTRGLLEELVDEENEIYFAIYYSIHYFSKPPSIIFLPNNTPDDIVNLLEESYSLFWLDHGSCINKLRILVEEILFELGIHKTYITESLQSLITRYKTQNLAVGEKLEAIKWAGNSGSHRDTNITRIQVLAIYKILENVFDDLYNQTDKMTVLNSVAEINQRKSI